MIRSGDSLPEGGATEFDIAIVGTGPVGLAVATRLAGRAGRIALVEAGGAQFEPADNLEFFKAARVDDPRHLPIELNRRRMLGGTTSVWGGRCIPLDAEDFAPTPERGGWPIALAEMDVHIPAALEFLDAGEAAFSAASVLSARPALFDYSGSDLVLDRIERYSKPTNVWRKWATTLARSRDVTVIHGATCKYIIADAEGSRVEALALGTRSHRSHKIIASTIVLACGGLETPRLLLASRGSRVCGLGNEHDNVGRFYMTHLVSNASGVGSIRFRSPRTARAFEFAKTFDGVYGRRMILLSPAARRRSGICNIAFRPSRAPIDDASHRDPVLSAMFLARRRFIPAEYTRSLTLDAHDSPSPILREHAANVVLGLPKLASFAADWMRRRVLARRKLPSVFLYRSDGTYPLEFNAEQLPNPDSRVSLGQETDSFGMPRLLVAWKMRDSELASICRAYKALAAAVVEADLGAVQLDPDLSNAVHDALVPQGGHHIGTVRMAARPRDGVVNPNAEVWGTHGLFIAGPAIFPTSGFANPTLTAVALAFRLAEHLIFRK